MNHWRRRVTLSECRWVWLVEDVHGYSAYLCLHSGRVHLFQDNGGLMPEPADDSGYLCISDLPGVIESLVGLQEQIEAIHSGVRSAM
jgi:hypothetical protein